MRGRRLKGCKRGTAALAVVMAAVLAAPGSVARATQSEQELGTDILDLAAGAVVISSSGSYSSVWPDLGLLDGSTKLGWCSPRDMKPPYTFVIELARPYRLKTFVIDNTGTEESGYPGISAREMEVWVSDTSATEGFQKVGLAKAPNGGRGVTELEGKIAGQWLKLVIVANGGREDFTELMELEAYGEPAGELRQAKDVRGVYATNYSLMRIEQTGSTVQGCYDHDGGTMRGSTDGRVIEFEWREDEGTQVGTAVMVLDSTAETLNGLWYEDGSYRGLWQGTRAEPGQQPACELAGSASQLEADLAATGRAIVYGIYFDSGSATLKAESQASLEELLAALTSKEALKVTLEGHTDSTNTEESNLRLSRQRAEAVRTWLVEKGVPAERIAAEGYGEAKPVADNGTPQGRRLNRRVEVVASL